MAATSAIQDINNNNEVVNRHEIQAAVAKAVELRALHAALMQGSSPTNLKFSSASPGSLYASHFSAQDYPVFTPVSIHLSSSISDLWFFCLSCVSKLIPN